MLIFIIIDVSLKTVKLIAVNTNDEKKFCFVDFKFSLTEIAVLFLCQIF